MSTNERGDLPSASNAARYASCPGSHRACIGLPDTTSEDAARGDRIHAWLEGMANGTIPPPLADPEERDVAERCLRQSGELIREHVGVECERLVEKRLWDSFRTWSGKADLVVIDLDGRAIVIDFKTGRGDVETAEGNLQLRALAVLVADLPKTSIDSVTVAIVQPLAGPPSVCMYGRASLDLAFLEIYEIMAKANATNQPRNPGPWCQYCRAAGTDRCPESKDNLVTIAATQANPALTADLGRWRDAADAAEEARKAFLRTVTIGKTKLEAEVAAVTGDRGKALKVRVETLLHRATETTFAAPSLARVKGGQP